MSIAGSRATPRTRSDQAPSAPSRKRRFCSQSRRGFRTFSSLVAKWPWRNKTIFSRAAVPGSAIRLSHHPRKSVSLFSCSALSTRWISWRFFSWVLGSRRFKRFRRVLSLSLRLGLRMDSGGSALGASAGPRRESAACRGDIRERVSASAGVPPKPALCNKTAAFSLSQAEDGREAMATREYNHGFGKKVRGFCKKGGLAEGLSRSFPGLWGKKHCALSRLQGMGPTRRGGQRGFSCHGPALLRPSFRGYQGLGRTAFQPPVIRRALAPSEYRAAGSDKV